ncbi:NAD(P)/FAD-dependent oxidoreductase [Aeromicrobium sp. Leaf350]|uniref:flavin-containing monooxygenase n=1 Tax=Aeromicrobium sp. Leaf350 TaxID=2876565 RepID=UPI001E314299|nr:NAD(P)/FAD-dependent oxidoreductase [Aeromicrobium sp. Leaf350]
MSADHVDVLIVGAGLSGIGAAHRLREISPSSSFTILEARDRIGGTWDLFRYPGIRSDSDMYTLSYPFRPWTHRKSIADGSDIRQYIEDTALADGVVPHIRFGHRVVRTSWSSDDARWTVTADGPDGPVTVTASFVYFCSGYYSYDTAYTPEFPGLDAYAGTVVHPQFWPDDLDVSGKRVVVIGSGATAVTLIPSLADQVEHITMLQRSPTFITSLPQEDALAGLTRRLLPDGIAHRITRFRNASVAVGFYEFCQRFPRLARKILLARARRALPEGFDVDTHLNPSYDPWDQRLCIVPNGDLFRALRHGRADIATGHIARFTEDGIELTDGTHLPADVVVTATGLQLVTFGTAEIEVDGQVLDPHELYVYKGLMFSGVPNLAWCVGYTNASWTLRADLTSQYVASFVEHLRSTGRRFGSPHPDGPGGDERPLLDLTSGYVQRVASLLPKQGTSRPWTIRQNWWLDSIDHRRTDLDEAMVWDTAPAKAPTAV